MFKKRATNEQKEPKYVYMIEGQGLSTYDSEKDISNFYLLPHVGKIDVDKLPSPNPFVKYTDLSRKCDYYWNISNSQRVEDYYLLHFKNREELDNYEFSKQVTNKQIHEAFKQLIELVKTGVKNEELFLWQPYKELIDEKLMRFTNLDYVLFCDFESDKEFFIATKFHDELPNIFRFRDGSPYVPKDLEELNIILFCEYFDVYGIEKLCKFKEHIETKLSKESKVLKTFKKTFNV